MSLKVEPDHVRVSPGQQAQRAAFQPAGDLWVCRDDYGQPYLAGFIGSQRVKVVPVPNAQRGDADYQVFALPVRSPDTP